jgi:hypothetical protein
MPVVTLETPTPPPYAEAARPRGSPNHSGAPNVGSRLASGVWKNLHLGQSPSVSAADVEQALVRAYVACQLALESIDDLPTATADAVGEPIREFCRALEPYVGHLADQDPRNETS